MKKQLIKIAISTLTAICTGLGTKIGYELFEQGKKLNTEKESRA